MPSIYHIQQAFGRSFFRVLSLVVLVFWGFSSSLSASYIKPVGKANKGIPEELKAAMIQEKLGASVDVEHLQFQDEEGKPVFLKNYFHGKPVILNLVYYGCPNLCGFVLQGFLDSLKEIDWTPGNQFEVVTVSIDPHEDSVLASKKKQTYLSVLNRPLAEKGWHFLVGQESQIQALAAQVGFGYRYDQEQKQYAHSAGLFVLTPEGKISRVLYGITYPKKDLRLALLEASSGRIGTMMDRVLLFCYRYDAHAKGYTLFAMRLVQAGGAGTVFLVGGFMAVYWRRQSQFEKEVS